MMDAIRAVARFWWLPTLGVVAGLLATVALIAKQPPAIYTALENVLVTSPSAPYLRTIQGQAITPTPPVAKQKKTPKNKNAKKAPAKTVTPQAAAAASAPPDTQVLVNAANLYPLLIQSDEIAKLRVKLYGDVPGRVSANALASSTNTYGVYHPSPLPVIQVKTTSRKPEAAEKLARDTTTTFETWIVERQKAAGIPASERITIEPLRVRVSSAGGTTLGMPLFAGLIVVLCFCGLAVVADRLRPLGGLALEDTAPATPHRRVA